MTTKSATTRKPAAVVVVLGSVNVSALMRKRPELFSDIATGERFDIVRPTPRANTGARRDFDGDATAWREHCRRAFKAADDRAADQCDAIALATAGGILNVIHASGVFDHDPANEIYSPIPNPRAYSALTDAADNVVALPPAD